MRVTSVAVCTLMALAGCSEGDEASPPAAPPAASLSLTVPSLQVAVPTCSAASIRLESHGVDVGCGTGCPTGSSTCVLSCPEYLGLVAGAASALAVVYLQAETPVASAPLGDVTLVPGENRLTVDGGSVSPLDPNQDGTTDLQTLCP